MSAIIPNSDQHPIAVERRYTVGQAANLAAAGAFADYRDRRAPNTLRRQPSDLQRFADYLAAFDVATTGADLQTDPAAWRGITGGLVTGFVVWMLQQGDAVGSVNLMLDHGLRVGEVALLQAPDFDLTNSLLTVFRPKVGKAQTLEMSRDTRSAARLYFAQPAPVVGSVWRPSAGKGRTDALAADRQGMSACGPSPSASSFWGAAWLCRGYRRTICAIGGPRPSPASTPISRSRCRKPGAGIR
ncbi:MAG: hypothetical protein GYB67_16940 [Chloroflexi bacterium]|nr:hypothetical protein [Chloroflexota bacterium]